MVVSHEIRGRGPPGAAPGSDISGIICPAEAHHYGLGQASSGILRISKCGAGLSEGVVSYWNRINWQDRQLEWSGLGCGVVTWSGSD